MGSHARGGDGMSTITLPARNTLRAIRGLANVPSKDGARPLLTVIQLQRRDGGGTPQVSLAATDSYRLAHTTFDASPKGRGDVDCLIPGELIALIRKVFARQEVLKIHDEESLTLEWNEDRVAIDFGGQRLSGPAVMGIYPDWRRLLPGDESIAHEPVAWNPEYLAELTTIRNEFWGGRQSIPVKLVVAQTTKPTLFRMSVQDDGQVDYLLMPVRVS